MVTAPKIESTQDFFAVLDNRFAEDRQKLEQHIDNRVMQSTRFLAGMRGDETPNDSNVIFGKFDSPKNDDPFAALAEKAASMGQRKQSYQYQQEGRYLLKNGEAPIMLSDSEIEQMAVAQQEQREFKLLGIPVVDAGAGALIGFISSEVIDGVFPQFVDPDGNEVADRASGSVNWINPGLKLGVAALLAGHRRLIGMQILPRQMALFSAIPLVATAAATAIPLDDFIQSIINIFSSDEEPAENRKAKSRKAKNNKRDRNAPIDLNNYRGGGMGHRIEEATGF